MAGELLSQAEQLIRDGLHPSEIADGYRKAAEHALRILDTLVREEKFASEKICRENFSTRNRITWIIIIILCFIQYEVLFDFSKT